MAARRVLLLGAGDLTDETAEALTAAGAAVTRLEDPAADELRDALGRGADAVAVVSRDDAWPLRAALLAIRSGAPLLPVAIAGMNRDAHIKEYLGYSDAGTLLAALYRNRIGHPVHAPMPTDIRRDGAEIAGRDLAGVAAPTVDDDLRGSGSSGGNVA